MKYYKIKESMPKVHTVIPKLKVIIAIVGTLLPTFKVNLPP
jgi:hypothetical protein